MARIAGMAGLIEHVGSPYVTVHQERCALVRNRNADCLRCAEACTSGCIAFEGGVLTIAPEKCIGCGTCASVCPTCCLEAHYPNDAELVRECLGQVHARGGRVAIACAAASLPAAGAVGGEGAARVECLGRVEESLITRLVADGATDIALLRGDCGACPHAAGMAVCELALSTEEALLRAWGRPMPAHVVDTPPAALPERSPDRDGRPGEGPGIELPADAHDPDLRPGPDRATDDAPPAPVFSSDGPAGGRRKPRYQKVMADGTLPHFVPDRRERLLDALAELGQADGSVLETRLWGHVEIDADLCTSCRMCAVFCPTGAIRKFDADDGAFGVTHAPGDCVKCMTCQNICRAGAIRVLPDVSSTDLLAGTSTVIEMRPVGVVRGQAHTIEQLAQLYTATNVYAR